MKTGHWIALIGGSIAALVAFACSSSDSGGGNFTPSKGGAGGSVVGKGGASNEGGSAQGGSAQGGSAQGGSSQGGSPGEGGSAQGGGGGTGGGGSCDTTTKMKSSECTTCAQSDTTCKAEFDACQGDTVCVNYATCMKDCNNDSTCEGGCASQHSTGMTKYWKYSGCIDATCHDQCYCTGCDLLKDGPCLDCVESSCQSQCATCAKDAACIGLWMCISYCPENDTICMGTCQQAPELASGLDPLLAFIGMQDGCITTACGTQCK